MSDITVTSILSVGLFMLLFMLVKLVKKYNYTHQHLLGYQKNECYILLSKCRQCRQLLGHFSLKCNNNINIMACLKTYSYVY